MFRYLLVAAAVVLLLSPAVVVAGGLPRLCVPIDGVTAENADECTKKVAAALGDEVKDVAMRQNDGQWYVMFDFNRDNLRLAEIEAALTGSPFSVPRERLRLFGHVILEIDPGSGSAEKLLADLKGVKLATVSETKREDGALQVTLAMPAPVYDSRTRAEFGNLPFRSETFRSEGQPDSDSPARLHDLPTYGSLRAIVEKHDASLTGLRWNCWACRVHGCVAVADSSVDRSPKAR